MALDNFATSSPLPSSSKHDNSAIMDYGSPTYFHDPLFLVTLSHSSITNLPLQLHTQHLRPRFNRHQSCRTWVVFNAHAAHKKLSFHYAILGCDAHSYFCSVHHCHLIVQTQYFIIALCHASLLQEVKLSTLSTLKLLVIYPILECRKMKVYFEKSKQQVFVTFQFYQLWTSIDVLECGQKWEQIKKQCRWSEFKYISCISP